jgi:hypothetical protein
MKKRRAKTVVSKWELEVAKLPAAGMEVSSRPVDASARLEAVPSCFQAHG